MAMNPLAVALDYSDPAAALRLYDRLAGRAGLFKVGSQLFTAAGPQIVRALVERGAPLFLDLKFHDIPRTVAAAAREAAKLGVAIFNVHASGGPEMMRAAVAAAREVRPETRVIAVTVLTSLEASEDQVLRLAESARDCDLDGVVAASREMRALRRRFGRDFLLVNPGVRPAWVAGEDDQKRVATPAEALAEGADYIVVGRPITTSADPAAAAARILEEISAAPGSGAPR
jgi:orotidine-5'-phosphate decarboxylase